MLHLLFIAWKKIAHSLHLPTSDFDWKSVFFCLCLTFCTIMLLCIHIHWMWMMSWKNFVTSFRNWTVSTITTGRYKCVVFFFLLFYCISAIWFFSSRARADIVDENEMCQVILDLSTTNIDTYWCGWDVTGNSTESRY